MTGKIILNQLIKTAGFLTLTVLTALIFNIVRPGSLPLVQDWDKIMTQRTQESLPGEMAVVSLEQMIELYRNQGVLVLDARPSDFFEFERIPGSRSLPVEQADRLIPELLKTLPPKMHIITYCDSASCHDGPDLARKIYEAGCDRVAVFSGGMQEWKQAGQPIQSDD